jgi:hypothetical protein
MDIELFNEFMGKSGKPKQIIRRYINSIKPASRVVSPHQEALNAVRMARYLVEHGSKENN